MRLDLNWLATFRVVAECGSISKATGELHLTQPAVSQQIQKLERQLGVRLFDRHNRGLVLTPLGRGVLEQARGLSGIERGIESLLEEQASSPKGEVRIGTYTTASTYLLADPVAEFLRRHPAVRITYVYEPTESVLEKVRGYKLDCAVISEVKGDATLEALAFFEDELVLAAARSRREARRGRITLAQMSETEYLSYPLRFEACYRQVEKRFGRELARCRAPVESESFDTLKQMLLRGVGLTWIPRYLIRRELARGELKEIAVGREPLPIVFKFVTKRGAALPRAVSALRDHLLQFFSGDRWQPHGRTR